MRTLKKPNECSIDIFHAQLIATLLTSVIGFILFYELPIRLLELLIDYLNRT